MMIKLIKKLLLKLGITDKESFFVFFKQFMKFSLVGLSNTIVNMAIYYGLIYLSLHYIAAYLIAFAVSVCNAFFWNSRFVFKKRQEDSNLKSLIRTFIAYGVTAALSTGTMYIMVDILSISEWIAPLINIFITTPINFLLIKFWAMRAK